MRSGTRESQVPCLPGIREGPPGGVHGERKNPVGKLLAERLDWSFRDFDEEIYSRVGLPIPEIFRQHGEGFFRDLEEGVGEELLQWSGVVLASGGGWPAAPGRMEGLHPRDPFGLA